MASARADVALALSRARPEAKVAVPALRPLLHDPDENVRVRVALARRTSPARSMTTCRA